MNSIADRALDRVRHLSVQGGSRPIESTVHLAVSNYISVVFTNYVASVQKQGRDILHTLLDTFDWINGARLAESTQMVPGFFEELDSQDPSWSQTRK